jgi:hypothetical protein
MSIYKFAEQMAKKYGEDNTAFPDLAKASVYLFNLNRVATEASNAISTEDLSAIKVAISNLLKLKPLDSNFPSAFSSETKNTFLSAASLDKNTLNYKEELNRVGFFLASLIEDVAALKTAIDVVIGDLRVKNKSSLNKDIESVKEVLNTKIAPNRKIFGLTGPIFSALDKAKL